MKSGKQMDDSEEFELNKNKNEEFYDYNSEIDPFASEKGNDEEYSDLGARSRSS